MWKVMLLLAGILVCNTAYANTVTLRNEPGGSLREHIARFEALRNQSVRLEGSCASACTIFLGLPDVCVGSNARFLFHGPMQSNYMPYKYKQNFDRHSRTVASFLPRPLQQWYMEVGRVPVGANAYVTLSARELVRIGAARFCT